MSRAFNIAGRLVAIGAILFLSVFALDVFGGGGPVGAALIGAAIHLLPNLVLVGVLVAAWRWPVAGAAFLVAGLLPFFLLSNPFLVNLMLGGPFLLAGLFFGLAVATQR